MAGQHFSERELAVLCLASVIPSKVENRAATEATSCTRRPKAEQVGSERITSLDIAGKVRLT
jgi:hypothetical protein